MVERNYAASHPVMRVSSKRFAVSPYLDRYATDDAVFGVYSGRLYPLTLGDDPIDSYRTLRASVALFDVPEHPIEIAGADAERFLDRVLTRDVTGMKVGRASYGLACADDGGVLMDGVLLRLSPDRFWWVLADGEILGWLRAHTAGLDVRIADPGSWVLQVQGPRSLDVLAAAREGGLPEPFGYFGVAESSIGGQDVLVSRTGWTGELGFEVYTLGPDADHDAIWGALMTAGDPHGMRVCGLEAMGIRRIEAGIADNGTDMDPSMTPFAAGLGAFVDLTKEAFPGKAALLAADRRPRLWGLSCPAATPVPGMTVLREDERVGRVTTGAWSPSSERGVGYVRFDEPGDWLGAAVTIAGDDGTRTDAEIVSLPLIDPEKRIPRGLDAG